MKVHHKEDPKFSDGYIAEMYQGGSTLKEVADKIGRSVCFVHNMALVA